MYYSPLKPLIACLGPRLLRGGSTGRFAYESRYRTGYSHEARRVVKPRHHSRILYQIRMTPSPLCDRRYRGQLQKLVQR